MNDLNIIKIKEKEFPEKLKDIKNSPKQLYAIGNIGLLFENCFGIVGTRNPTEYGMNVCEYFSTEFAMRDICIVSGLACGIDTISHNIAMKYNSKTIGIIGCGFNKYIEEKENLETFYKIVTNKGLILSEYDLNVDIDKENFPQRNRIIAAISEGILVVEAAYRSGSSITARYANSYGKKVFAIPGKINEKMSVGTNNLIKKGAILVSKPEEIFERYPQFANKKRKTIFKNKKNNEIVELLEKEKLSLDELQLKTKKELREIIKIVGALEMEGVIKEDIGGGYILIK